MGECGLLKQASYPVVSSSADSELVVLLETFYGLSESSLANENAIFFSMRNLYILTSLPSGGLLKEQAILFPNFFLLFFFATFGSSWGWNAIAGRRLNFAP